MLRILEHRSWGLNHNFKNFESEKGVFLFYDIDGDDDDNNNDDNDDEDGDDENENVNNINKSKIRLYLNITLLISWINYGTNERKQFAINEFISPLATGTLGLVWL